MKSIDNYQYKPIKKEDQIYKISVCIVIYNIAEYLERAIESAINQTYGNLEIILIDDGSTDGSAEICDKYANLDSRIVVCHKENGGVSSARNAAIELASGDYITYLDGDDYIEPVMYETLMSAMLCENTDMAVCRYRQVTKDEVLLDGETHSAYVFEGRELLETFLLEDEKYTIQNAPWNKLYKRELIGDLRFPDGIYEDALFTPLLLDKSSRSIYVDISLYNYVCDRQSSIMHKTKVNSHMFSELIPNFVKRSEYIRSTGREDLALISDYFLYKRLLIFVTEVNRSKDSNKKEYLRILDGYIKGGKDKYSEVYSVYCANANEYRKMKIYLTSKALYRIVMFINDNILLPIKTKRYTR